jgi:predicted nucleotidyltransferase
MTWEQVLGRGEVVLVQGLKEKIAQMAGQYGLQIIYAFGSRAKEVLEMVEGRLHRLSSSPSDLDIGVKPERRLTVEEKVEIAIFFEDLFDLPRVDVVVLPEAPVSLAEEIVTGEILYARDSTFEAEYQLYIMRMAADLLPYEKEKQKMILGV